MNVANPFAQLLELQRDLYEKAYQEALSLDLLGLGLLGKYAEEYEHSVPNTFRPSSLAKLIDAIETSRYVLYGDFHTLKQSQRGLLRVLRHLPSPRSYVVAMEMFAHEDQSILDAFMVDQISEEEFMRKIEYRRKWGFPWAHYLPIVQWAKDARVQVVGINFPGNVVQRDLSIAAKLKELGDRYADKSFIVMIGEHHLADQHLPLQMSQKDIDNAQVLRVFTNVEKFFFSGRRIQVDPTEYLDLGRHRFCIQNSPPWIKWQSVAVFSELSSGDMDDVWYDDDSGAENPDDRFHSILENLVAFLQVRASAPLDDFYIYRFSSSDFFQHLKTLYPDDVASTFMSIAEAEGVMFPLMGRGLFLGEYTQNNLIQLAGEYLRGMRQTQLVNVGHPRDLFLRVLFNACAGRVASKIFNPRRKGMSFDDVRTFLKVHSRRRLLGSAKQQRQALKNLLALHDSLLVGRLPSEKNQIWREDEGSNFVIARNLGNILGQDIYQQVMRGQRPKQLMTDLFFSTLSPVDLLDQVYAGYRQQREKVPA